MEKNFIKKNMKHGIFKIVSEKVAIQIKGNAIRRRETNFTNSDLI